MDHIELAAGWNAMTDLPFPPEPHDEQLARLVDGLASIQVGTPADQEILQQCHAYFAAMRRLDAALRT